MSPEAWVAQREAENARVKGARYELSVVTADGKKYAWGFIGKGDGKQDDNIMKCLGMVGLQCLRYAWDEKDGRDDQA